MSDSALAVVPWQEPLLVEDDISSLVISEDGSNSQSDKFDRGPITPHVVGASASFSSTSPFGGLRGSSLGAASGFTSLKSGTKLPKFKKQTLPGGLIAPKESAWLGGSKKLGWSPPVSVTLTGPRGAQDASFPLPPVQGIEILDGAVSDSRQFTVPTGPIPSRNSQGKADLFKSKNPLGSRKLGWTLPVSATMVGPRGAQDAVFPPAPVQESSHVPEIASCSAKSNISLSNWDTSVGEFWLQILSLTIGIIIGMVCIPYFLEGPQEEILEVPVPLADDDSWIWWPFWVIMGCLFLYILYGYIPPSSPVDQLPTYDGMVHVPQILPEFPLDPEALRLVQNELSIRAWEANWELWLNQV
jgi:hypothetical protein